MLTKGKTGLVVIDVQGKLSTVVHDSERFIANLVKLIKAAKLLDMPILWLEQNPEKLGQTVPELQEVLGSVTPISKFSFSACSEPAFVEAVKKTR